MRPASAFGAHQHVHHSSENQLLDNSELEHRGAGGVVCEGGPGTGSLVAGATRAA